MAAVNCPTSNRNPKMGGGMSSSKLGVWGWVPGKGQPPIELDLVRGWGEAVDSSGGKTHSWSVSAFMLTLEEKIAISVAQNTQLS